MKAQAQIIHYSQSPRLREACQAVDACLFIGDLRRVESEYQDLAGQQLFKQRVAARENTLWRVARNRIY